jgi:flagellar biosynthetic protein FlhB
MAGEMEHDKSEEPTPFKLMRARRKGTVARGMDLGFLTALSAFFGYAWILGPSVGHKLSHAVQIAFVGGPQLADSRDALLQAAMVVLSSAVAPIALLAGCVFAIVLLFELLQTGFVFSGEPLKPNFSKLNPAQGLKRIFSLRLLIETGKQILKLCSYTTVGYLIIRAAVQTDSAGVTDAASLAAAMAHVFFKLLGAFLLLAVVFAALDQMIVRRDFLKRMRMSRREMRQEMRDREGEPRLKQKRKQLHAGFVKASQSIRGMRKADVLITNPTHVAIALHYDRRTMTAPLVVSTGTDRFAQRLKRMAFIYGVPVFEKPELARELLRTSALNRPIPGPSFQAVAAIYNTISKKKAALAAERP